MTWTYSPSATPDDVTKVRYYTGDVVQAAAIHSDEEIEMVLALESDDVGAACESLIISIMERLAHEPDGTADWLKVDWRRSAEQWEKLLTRVRQKFGIGPVDRSSATHAWRADSYQTEEPDWAAAFGDLDD